MRDRIIDWLFRKACLEDRAMLQVANYELQQSLNEREAENQKYRALIEEMARPQPRGYCRKKKAKALLEGEQ